MKPSTVVYWSRFFLAIAAALIVYFLRLKGSEAVVSVALVVYVFSVVLVKYALGYGEEQLKGRYRHVTLGAGTFIFVWLSALVLMYTIAPY